MIYYMVTLHALAGFLLIDKIGQSYTIQPRVQTAEEIAPTPASEASPTVEPSIVLTPHRGESNPGANQGTAQLSQSSLIIPVQGIRSDQLVDSFSAARSEGRVHDAIDIMAPAGTPILAAADGQIAKFFDSKAGGTTIYEWSVDKKFVYYYAHLQSRAADIHEGDIVKQGKIIAFVGDTGNAGPGNYHLHFGISAVTDPKHYWEGTPVNPYPLLRH
jgi:murein DD-endopeptidase MepM/ murein hydrolase activator NlpD